MSLAQCYSLTWLGEFGEVLIRSLRVYARAVVRDCVPKKLSRESLRILCPISLIFGAAKWVMRGLKYSAPIDVLIDVFWT